MLENVTRRILFWGLFTISLLALDGPINAHARELQGRLGMGYNAQFANNQAANAVPGVGFKYGMTRDIALEAIVGLSTESPSNSVTAVKFFKNLFYETNLNFYFMLGGGLLSANAQSGVEFQGGFGTEFFIPGLESIGWSMEMGGSFDNLKGSFAVKTMGVSFLNAGMRFYF